MHDDIKQDFETASVKHFLFKSKLRSFLYGSGTAEGPIRDPNLCSLGKWINERALVTYKHLPEAHELNRVHRQIHEKANQLMDLRLAGETEQAITGLADVQVMADRIVQLLRAMEEKLRHGR
ncbi:CZB domain-containing protein [Hymenobacter crusticola]|uniref:Chemoreceptor zinc-binding domain-containing protein n=1 Tax=Hymenobacter crusticola TaxID=1770526 RepID=A0A243WI81_9BACT|nr:CZB domain-containing protein [Hymenobacter crusticola]OUJ75551.1 hypothetical protein BXP70_05955 [Hymenobacter crusticola]